MKQDTLQKRITALEYALQYTPGSDDNHSHSVLLEMLGELCRESETPAVGQPGNQGNYKLFNTLIMRDLRRNVKWMEY